MYLNEVYIKKYLPLQTQGVSAKFEGFEIRALYKYFPKYLGQTLVDILADENPDQDLFEKVTPAWIVLTFLESIPFLDVVSTNTGFGVVNSQTVGPASRERVEAIRMACQSAANDYMDILLAFMEQHAGDYPGWNKSSLNEGSMIPNVSVFDQFIDINVSRSKFVAFKRYINQVEAIRLPDIFSAEFLAELRAGNDTVVKPLVQRALTFFAMGEFDLAIKDDASAKVMMRSGDEALAKALSYLKSHLADYPTYSTYGYEAAYDNENDGEESGFFIAGGTA